MAMIRLRKYRIFLFVAFICLLTLWYVSKDASWDEAQVPLPGLTASKDYPPQDFGHTESPLAAEKDAGLDLGSDGVPLAQVPDGPTQPPIFPQLDLKDGQPETPPTSVDPPHSPAVAPEEIAPPPRIEETKTTTPVDDEVAAGIGADKAATKPDSDLELNADAAAPPTPTPTPAPDLTEAYAAWTPPPPEEEAFVFEPQVYTWVSKKENYPIPSGSTIQLPTGTPIAIPKIQFEFKGDPPSIRNERQVLLNSIRDSMKRSWAGYRKYAWMKDELRPVTGGSHDKFMGWAATLIDSLDTLYIMGMDREFEEAVAATANITFKSSTHTTIPMFETTIRYLGGLLGAYDVSGGQHPILLEKAVELGEVLMGAFDTENHMPILYYPFAANELPQRASKTACLAELGSLSIEFTRLSQLTKEPRYYDAVARITNGLEELQNKTTLPGLWPLQIDLSGCMNYAQMQRTAANNSPPKDAIPIMDKDITSFGDDSAVIPVAQMNTTDGKTAEQLLRDVTTDTFADDVKEIKDATLNSPEESVTRDVGDTTDSGDAEAAKTTPTKTSTENSVRTKRELSAEDADLEADVEALGLKLDLDELKIDNEALTRLGVIESEPPKETCISTGLQSGQSYGAKYTLGGEADSTYEYLPKEYLLLGGLNDQYRKMYEASQAATIEYLLYRAMIPDSKRELLFTGAYYPLLTNDEDIVGRRIGSLNPNVGHLTCFVGGMFALGAKIFNRTEDLAMAAKLTDGCVWAYESTATGIMPEDLAPMPCDSIDSCAWNETAWHLSLDPMGTSRDLLVQEAMKDAKLDPNVDALAEPMPGAPPVNPHVKFSDFDKRKRQLDDAPPPAPEPAAIPDKEEPAPVTPDAATAKDTLEDAADNNTKEETRDTDQWAAQLPMTHVEFVNSRIEKEGLWPGITTIQSRRYLLRPEAIESVFYMYRITGKEEWRRKGFKMFMAVEAATKVKYGNSAIMDVTNKATPVHANEMESFWSAETLKYFFLLFSDPDVVSLDDYVFNTEAHPMLRPGAEWKRIRSILKNN